VRRSVGRLGRHWPITSKRSNPGSRRPNHGQSPRFRHVAKAAVRMNIISPADASFVDIISVSLAIWISPSAARAQLQKDWNVAGAVSVMPTRYAPRGCEIRAACGPKIAHGPLRKLRQAGQAPPTEGSADDIEDLRRKRFHVKRMATVVNEGSRGR